MPDSITLLCGQWYDVDKMAEHFIGWSDNQDHDDYTVWDFFYEGIYAGPDEDGIEPVFRIPTEDLTR